MFGKKKNPVPPAMEFPEFDSSPEYVDRYNAAWEEYYEAQANHEAKNLETGGL